MTTPKKILAGVAVIALTGGGFWLLKTGRTEIKYNSITPEQAQKAIQVLSTDTDKDGLKDWEEELWHTDQKKPDTDGDGTPDAEEIRLGRDPVKMGPDDKLDKETIEKKTVPGGGDWTETDRLSRELFGKYLTMRKSGAPFTAEDERKLLEEFANRPMSIAREKIYTEQDVVLAASNGETALRAYGNALGKVVTAHIDKGENELIIFERALQNEDPQDLAGLENRVKRYENMLADLTVIPVPPSATSIHIALLDALEGVKEAIAGMAIALNDPVHALPYATAYPPAFEKLLTSLTDIINYFEQKQITFGKNEPGAILLK